MDLLVRFDRSSPLRLDPSGDDALRRAKQVRRDAMRFGGSAHVREEAERAFGLPRAALGYSARLSPVIYDPSRSLSN